MATGSRREFLKSASLTTVGLTAARTFPAWGGDMQVAGPVKVWGTFRDRRHAALEPLAWKPATAVSPDSIMLDPGVTQQEMLGFGAAFTDASCYLLNQLARDKRAELMRELFAPDQMAMNVCRTCIGASDYSTSLYSYDDSEQDDPELAKFSIDHDKAYILPALREARKLNPELFLFSSPWSPPAWMKFNRNMKGGTIRKSSLEPYSRYFQRFLEAYKAEGVEINAITIQNEVDTTVDGRYASCLLAQEDEILFVGKYLGPLFRKENITTRIWVLDHNFTLWGRAIGELSDAKAAEFIDGIAWHGYAGVPSAMTTVHEAFPQKHAYFTEGGPQREPHVEGTPFPDPWTGWSHWAAWANDVVRNWARSITVWNLALDENGTPYIGIREEGDVLPGQSLAGHGLIQIDSKNREVTRTGRFWAMAHYTKHVRRGARVLRTSGVGGDKVSHVGFRNPDGSFVVVLANSGGTAKVQLVMGGKALDVDVAADSVHTLEWA